jgi:forkhead protein FKH
MPPSGKRAQRPRRDSRKEADRPDDSSPSRPAKRRKQASTRSHLALAATPTKLTRTAQSIEQPQEVPDLPEEEGSSALADSSALNQPDDTEIVTRVASHLLVPKEVPFVQASKSHANTLHAGNEHGVQAYAKIAGRDWTYYVTSVAIKIGRISEPRPQYPPEFDPEEEEDYVHVDLGPSKLISRQHAQIQFNPKEETWFLKVNGRNGLRVNGNAWKSGSAKPLDSGDVFEIGGIEMMFVLPLESSALRIQDTYMDRAGLAKSLLTSPPQGGPGGKQATAAEQSTPVRSALPKGQAFQQPIAPAPPDYKRPGTPPSARTRPPMSQNKSPQFRDATMLMNASDVDLSLDENKHCKPQFSYAQMITQAIMHTKEEKLNLSGIYTFIMENYAYYRYQAAAGWQVSQVLRPNPRPSC